jgi:Major Facilitator Superfamily
MIMKKHAWEARRRPDAGHHTTFSDPDTPRSHLTLECLHQPGPRVLRVSCRPQQISGGNFSASCYRVSIYGAIAAAGSVVGLLLGGALTEYLSWRWTLYVNLVIAAVALAGAALLLERHPSRYGSSPNRTPPDHLGLSERCADRPRDLRRYKCYQLLIENYATKW